MAVFDPHSDLVRKFDDPQQEVGDHAKGRNTGGARKQEYVEEGNEGRDRPSEKPEEEYPKYTKYYSDS